MKLLREGKKSRIIEEINADITAYAKKYDRQMFIVYDLGTIRDDVEFRRDIEDYSGGGLNEELKAKGYRTICGKVPTKYFEEKFYGLTVAL